MTDFERPLAGEYALGVSFKLKRGKENKFQKSLLIISVIFGQIQNKLFILR